MTERAEQQARREEAAEERLADMRATIEHLRREREARLAEFHALTHPKATPTPPAERPMVEAVAAAEPAPASVVPTWDATDAAAAATAAPTSPTAAAPEARPDIAEEPVDGPGEPPAGVDDIASDEASGPEPPADPDDIALPSGVDGVEFDEIPLVTAVTVDSPVPVLPDAPEPVVWPDDEPSADLADLATDSDIDAAREDPPLLGEIVVPQRPSEPVPEPAGAPASAARLAAGGAVASWRVWAALAIAIGGYAAWTTSRPAIAPAGNAAPEAPRASVPTPAVPSPMPALARPAAAPATPPQARPTSPAAATRTAGLRVVLRATRPVWVRAAVDGAVTVNRTVPAGGEITLSATDAVEVRVGDAGAVRITVNGEDRGLAGRNGQVITWRYVAEPATARR